MRFKQRLLDIQHRLNAMYGNNDDLSVVRRLNLLNSDLFEMVALREKGNEYIHLLETIREERENLSPLQTTQMELMDFLIYELDALVYSKV